jgi:PAS domain S-box-containing protein/diguanylate cyclase (GGDEF)-like protein
VRYVAEVSRDVVYQTRVDGVIEWVQPTVPFQLGYQPEEMVGTTAMSYVHPDDLAMASRLRLTVYEGAELDDIPCRFRVKDGSYRRCLVRARPVRDVDGRITGSVIALREAVAAEASLRALATLLAANTEMVRATDEAELLGAMCRTIVATGGYDLAWYGSKEADGSISVLASAGRAEDILGLVPRWDGPPGTGALAGTAIATGEPQRSHDLHRPELAGWAQDIDRFELRSALSIPVRRHGDVVGVLAVASQDQQAFDDQAEVLLENLAADLGYGLGRLNERALLFEVQERDAEQGRRLRGVLDAQLDPLVVLAPVRDASGRITGLRYVEANQAATAYNRVTYDELIGRTFAEIHPALRSNGLADRYAAVIETGDPVVLDDYAYANPNLDGDERRYDIRAVKSGDAVALTWRDVTDRYAAQERLTQSEERYRTLVEHMSDVVWETREDGTFGWVSESMQRVLGWRPDELVGQSTLELIHVDDRPRVGRNRDAVGLGLTVRDEVRLRAKDGGFKWMSLTAQLTHRRDGEVRIVAVRDIDAEVSGRAELDYASRHDPVTGLITRAVILRRLQAMLDDGVPVAAYKVGVDGLARINESLGHEAGDAVLSSVAARMLDLVSDEHVARGSGDEIIILGAGITSGNDAESLADAVRTAARAPLTVEGHTVVPTVSVGINLSGAETSAERLLGEAGIAMRAAKGVGPDRSAFVDPDLAAQARNRVALEAELREALAAGELQPWFQPVVDLATSEVVGYEALVRWLRPEGRVLAPDAFMPVAERGALVLDLDRTVLDQAVAALQRIPSRRSIAVNVSAASIASAAYVDHVLRTLAYSGVSPSRLYLEITETVLVSDTSIVAINMRRIADLGVRWYVDDFGTGYSSIAHLRDLPIAGLKLDRSFTAGIGSGDATSVRLAQALAGLAAGLGLDTVAEGVETDEEAAYLQAQGWVHGQGWLYGKAEPVPLHAVARG